MMPGGGAYHILKEIDDEFITSGKKKLITPTMEKILLKVFTLLFEFLVAGKVPIGFSTILLKAVENIENVDEQQVIEEFIKYLEEVLKNAKDPD